MAPYVTIDLIAPLPAALLGGTGLALGALTYSRNVVMLVGRRITALDPVSALVATLSAALTVHFFTQLAIPISTSQAIVGAVAGVGLTKGMMAVNPRTLAAIPVGWTISVVGTGLIAFLMLAAYRALQ
jgi:PiT family inorganic phosphate transporter